MAAYFLVAGIAVSTAPFITGGSELSEPIDRFPARTAASPSPLANALGAQASRALDEGRIDWQEVPLGQDDSFPDISVLRWPLGTRTRQLEADAQLDGRSGAAPHLLRRSSSTGSSCRLSHVRYYGEVWVASAGV